MSWWDGDTEVTCRDGLEQYVGFVYLITNQKNGRQYWGQKVFENKVKKAPLKGNSRPRRSTKETWLDYYGSSIDLKEDVRKFGKDNFHREIIQFCESKSELNYYEAKYIMLSDAVIDPKYYNKWVNCKAAAHQLGKLIAKWNKPK